MNILCVWVNFIGSHSFVVHMLYIANFYIEKAMYPKMKVIVMSLMTIVKQRHSLKVLSSQIVPVIVTVMYIFRVQVQLHILEAILEQHLLHPLFHILTVMDHHQEFWTVATVF